jgi:hypothetical protein
MGAQGLAAIEVTRAAQARFNARLQAKLARSTWADAGCKSWYKTADGRVTQNWGWNCDAYAEATRTLALEDYALRPGGPLRAA